MLGWWWLRRRATTLADYSVIGCFLFCFFMGMGLLGLILVAIYRFKGTPYSGEGTVVAASLLSIAMSFGIPMAKSIGEWVHKD